MRLNILKVKIVTIIGVHKKHRYVRARYWNLDNDDLCVRQCLLCNSSPLLLVSLKFKVCRIVSVLSHIASYVAILESPGAVAIFGIQLQIFAFENMGRPRYEVRTESST